MFPTTIRSRLLAGAALFCLAALSLAALDDAPVPRIPHPHFPKTLTCTVSKELEITVRYMTVTYDKAGAEKMAVGKAWHLAGATFETTRDLVVGGQKVAAGKYALSARKAENGWELTLHEGQGFSRPKDDALVLETKFVGKTVKYEHLNVDIQPGGDKEHTELFLEVRFDEMLAQAKIEIPE